MPEPACSIFAYDLDEIATPPMKLANRFELLDVIDEGGYGITYRALDHHQPSRLPCVVKALTHTDASALKRFRQEAEMLEVLGGHPRIPRLLAYFDEGNRFYIAQELVKGHHLGHEITDGQRLSEGYVRQLLREVLEILAFVHGHRVVHRDIKPANLLRRTRDSAIFLIDFGAVKELSAGGSATAAVGTVGYMALEQRRGQPCYASDLYSLGMVAVAALTGISPQRLSTYPRTGRLRWPQDTPQIAPELQTFVERLVSPQPRQRYADGAAAFRAFQALKSSPANADTEADSKSDGPLSDAPTRVVARGLPTTLTTTVHSAHSLPAKPLFKAVAGIAVVLILVGGGVKGYQWATYTVSTRVQEFTLPGWDHLWSRLLAGWRRREALPVELADLLADGSIQARPETVTAFWAMTAAAKQDGVNLFPLGGYVSKDDQRLILEQQNRSNIDRWLSQSDYHTGYGLDIGDRDAPESTDRDASFARTAAYSWLRRNAASYGFQLSYPRANPAGEQEPWHWRYVAP